MKIHLSRFTLAALLTACVACQIVGKDAVEEEKTAMKTKSEATAAAPAAEKKPVRRAKLFSVNIRTGAFHSVRGGKGSVNMILFDGDMKSAFFEGKIVSGGVDTQKTLPGLPTTLSARYILEGKDASGKPAKLFIENNGASVNGEITTKPVIFTDNASLRWLEEADLEGKVANGASGLVIEFYAPENVVKAHAREKNAN